MIRGRSIRLAAVGVALLSAGPLAAQGKPWMDQRWHEYVFEEDGFAVLSPVPPKREVVGRLTDAGAVEIHSYTMSLDWDHVLVVSCTDFGDKMSYKTPERVIEDVRRGSLLSSGPDARVVNQHRFTVQGSPAVEVEYVSGSFRFVSRIMYIKGVLIQLIAKSPAEESFEQERRDFFHSFRLLGRFQPSP